MTLPRKGDALLFYSQKPNGELDPMSLHGGCPVVQGQKWAANLWIWNLPRPSFDNTGKRVRWECCSWSGVVAVKCEYLRPVVQAFFMVPSVNVSEVLLCIVFAPAY